MPKAHVIVTPAPGEPVQKLIDRFFKNVYRSGHMHDVYRKTAFPAPKGEWNSPRLRRRRLNDGIPTEGLPQHIQEHLTNNGAE